MKDRQCHSGESPVNREAPYRPLSALRPQAMFFFRPHSNEQLALSVTEAGPALTDLFSQSWRANTRVALPGALCW